MERKKNTVSGWALKVFGWILDHDYIGGNYWNRRAVELFEENGGDRVQATSDLATELNLWVQVEKGVPAYRLNSVDFYSFADTFVSSVEEVVYL